MSVKNIDNTSANENNRSTESREVEPSSPKSQDVRKFENTAKYEKLSDLAKDDKKEFNNFIKNTFDTSPDGGISEHKIEELRGKFVSGDTSWKPQERNVNIEGAQGGFAKDGPGGKPQIFIDKGLAGEARDKVLTEEAGHAIDHFLRDGKGDAAGDEGALFKSALYGEKVEKSALTENDKTAITVDGKKIEVEAARRADTQTVGATGLSEAEIQNNFSIALKGAKAFFATDNVPALPDGIGGKMAGEVFEASTANSLNALDAGGYHMTEFMKAYADLKQSDLTLDRPDYADMQEMTNNYSNWMTRVSSQVASDALSVTSNVAQDTKNDHEALKAHQQARAFGIAAGALGLASSPGSIKGVVDAVGQGTVPGVKAGIDTGNSLLGNARGQWLTQQLDPAVNSGNIATPASSEAKEWGDKIGAQFGSFQKFLSEEGYNGFSDTVAKANKFGSEVMERSTQEAFAVGTLLDLRVNHAHARFTDSRKERSYDMIQRGNEYGPADRFAARDLEQMGYHTQIASTNPILTATSKEDYQQQLDQILGGKGTYSSQDIAPHVPNYKIADANNLFVHNYDDNVSGLPTAGLSIWDNDLDVSVTNQLDRIDDRWHDKNDHNYQMQKTLEWIANQQGFNLSPSALS